MAFGNNRHSATTSKRRLGLISIPTLLLLAVLFFTLPSASLAARSGLIFRDVTRKYGLPREYRIKYGGASLSDLDGDDLLDIVEFHHTECCATIHFNNGPGRPFTKSSFKFKADIHAIVPFRPNPHAQAGMRYAAVVIGGSNGKRPTQPNMLTISSNRTVSYATQSQRKNLFPPTVKGRGRTIIFTNLRRSSRSKLGAVLINAPVRKAGSGGDGKKPIQAALEWKNGRFNRIKKKNVLGALATDPNNYALVTDIDNDGYMEVVTFEELRVYNLTRDLHYTDVSASVGVPDDPKRPGEPLRGVSGLAEIDFNNDGLWDLYVIRSSEGDLKWLRSLYRRKFEQYHDFLLINRGGKRYESRKMRRLLGGSHRGVHSGDFNNDGFVDLYVCSQSNDYDFLLLNHYGIFFSAHPMRRFRRGPGDMVHVLDVNKDGKLDLLVSTGDWHDTRQRGQFYMLENISKFSKNNVYPNYLFVHVFDSPSRKVTSLYAVARVKIKGRKGVMMRRVGGSNGPGTALSVSHHLHFGLGKYSEAEWVVVTWSTGEKQSFSHVQSKSTLIAGRR